MKVLACIILALGSAAALRSGPYLPSGWRPDGPAFLLPSEVAKPIASIKEEPAQESEASGSDFLREYGPPKVQEVSQDLTQQALPDIVTEQSFAIIDARFNDKEEVKAEDGITEEISQENLTTEQTVTIAIESDVTTEEKAADVTEQVIKGKSIDFDTETDLTLSTVLGEATTEKFIETQQVENANSNIVSTVEEKVELEIQAVEERVEKEFEAQIQTVEEKIEKVVEAKAIEEVQNIADALVNLEYEINAQQVGTQEVAEVKSVQESSGSLEKTAEGFLEYGPPGFREYGPPKDELLRSEAVIEAKPISEAAETNETRRRRFSPKFRQTTKWIH